VMVVGVDHSLDSTLMSDAFRLMVHYAFLVILSKGWNQGMTRLWLSDTLYTWTR